MPNQNPEELLTRITSICNEVIQRRNTSAHDNRLSFQVTVKNSLPSAHIEPDHPLAIACKTAVQQVVGITPDIRGTLLILSSIDMKDVVQPMKAIC
jgi:hypothetical protein